MQLICQAFVARSGVDPCLFSHFLIIALSSEYLFVHCLTLCLILDSHIDIVFWIYLSLKVFIFNKKHSLQLSLSLSPYKYNAEDEDKERG